MLAGGPATPPLSADQRFGRRIMPVGLLVLAMAALANALTVWQLRMDALADARMNAGNLGNALAGQVARTVQAVDNTLHELQERVSAPGIGDPLSLDPASLGSRALHDLLVERARRLPQVDTLTVVGADGRLLNFSRSWPVPTIGLADRDYFIHLSTTPEHALFISRPVANRANGTWEIFLARRLEQPDGSFAGVLMAGVPLQSFRKMMDSVLLPAGGSFLLLRSDGIVLTRYPDTTARAGLVMPAGSPWYRQVAAGGGFYRSDGVFDKVTRHVAVRPVGEYPLVVDLAMTEATILARWQQQASMIAGVTAVLLLAGVVLLLALRRQVARQDEARATLLRANAELEAGRQALAGQRKVLETILNSMDQGLMMIDADRRVAVCNRQAMEVLELPPELLARQPLFEEVLEYQWRTGEFARADMELQTFIRAAALLDGPPVYERRRPDGRVIEVRTVPQEGGGVVRTYTDITSRRNAEDRIRHVAHHDDLTQLANRVAFNQILHRALTEAARDGLGVALLYLDLDYFKQVNDAHGHAVGDALLAEVAQRMRAVVRESDTVARMGGDEFAIIQPAADGQAGTLALARRLLEVITVPFQVGGLPAAVGVSIGIAWYPTDGLDAETLLRHADAALYAAKREGRNTFRCYEPAPAPTPALP